jgi:hypothetical protein
MEDVERDEQQAPPEGGLLLRREGVSSDINLDGNVGAYPIRLPSLQSLSLEFRESWIGTNRGQATPIRLYTIEACDEGVIPDLAADH